MSWLLYTSIGVFLFSLVNIFDKILITKYIHNSKSLAFYKFLLWVMILAIVPFTGYYPVSTRTSVLLLAANACGLFAFVFYYKALAIEEASRVIPLLQIQSLFVMLISFMFLGDRLTTMEMGGFVLVLIGGFLISFKDKFTISRASLFVVSATFFWGIGLVIFSHLYATTQFWSTLITSTVFASLLGWVLLFEEETKKNCWDFIIKQGKNAKLLLVFDGLLHVTGIVVFSMGVRLGPVTLVSVINGLQGFFVFAIALLLSRWFPKILKEDMNTKMIVQKSVAILLMFTGVVLLNL